MLNHPRPPGWADFTPHQRLAWRKRNNTNSTGFVGVKEELSGKFSASIYDPRTEKKTNLGMFPTAAEAGDAYENAFAEIYGEEPDQVISDDPHGMEDLRELVNQHYPPHHPMPFELSEMIRTEILPLLKDDP